MGEDENRESSEEAPYESPPLPKEPSFHGRLQLQDFMFSKACTPQVSPRRSPRKLAPSHSSDGDTKNATGVPKPSSPSPASATKRKSRGDTLASPSKGSPTSSSSSSPRKRQRAKVPAGYAPPSTYAHLSPLPDAIAPNLLILFIGLNPGVQTARTGHAYAHPSNLFWKLLFSSGITPVPCRPEEDATLPARFSLGNTNIVSRPSRNGAELSKAEMDEGVAMLEAKCRRYRPEVVCVVGKSIWESIFRVRRGRNLNKNDGFEYGWQEERMGVVSDAGQESTPIKDEEADGEIRIKEEGLGDEGSADWDNEPWEGSRIFVATSTSGLAATLRPAEKERIWKILGDWCVQRRRERNAAGADEVAEACSTVETTSS